MFRFQEIAGGLEEKLSQPLAEACADHKGAGGGNGDGGGDALSSSGGDRKSLPSPPFKLELFHMLWRCISRCWQDGVFVQALIHRFWKLTLQVNIHIHLSCNLFNYFFLKLCDESDMLLV